MCVVTLWEGLGYIMALLQTRHGYIIGRAGLHK